MTDSNLRCLLPLLLLLGASLLIGFQPGLVTSQTQDYCKDIAKNVAETLPAAPAPSAR